jgi:integrase
MDRKFRGVTARNDRIQISFTYQKNRCREIIPREPNAKNLKDAFEIKQMILTEIKLGTFDYAKRFPNSVNAKKHSTSARSLITIEEALNNWLRVHQRHLAMSTIRDYNSAINFHLIPIFGHIYLSDLTAPMVKNWIASLKISTKRINNIMTPLRMIFEEAFEDEVIPKNPLKRIRNLPVKTREPEPFRIIEIYKILKQLSGQDHTLIKTAFWTGMRTSELIGLRWSDIDFTKRKIYIRNVIVRNTEKEPKTKSGIRSIDLNCHSLSALIAQKKESYKLNGYVFTDPKDARRPLDDQKIRKKIWKPALEKAGIKYREPYQTRHTFASRMLMQKKTPFWVSRQMGHASPVQTYKSYARWIDNE